MLRLTKCTLITRRKEKGYLFGSFVSSESNVLRGGPSKKYYFIE